MINSPVKSIIFDMDGTLLDSSHAMTQSVNYVREILGLEPVSKEFLEFHINEPDQNLPMIFYGTPEYDPAHRELFKDHYLENANLHVKPYDGAYEMLESLHVKGITLSIATNASDFFAKNMLKGQGMLDFFSFIVGANNVEKSKPSPDMLELIIERSNIPLHETILIGDSIKDEEASNNANIDFYFANWGYGRSQSSINRFDTLRDLHKHLEKIII